MKTPTYVTLILSIILASCTKKAVSYRSGTKSDCASTGKNCTGNETAFNTTVKVDPTASQTIQSKSPAFDGFAVAIPAGAVGSAQTLKIDLEQTTMGERPVFKLTVTGSEELKKSVLVTLPKKMTSPYTTDELKYATITVAAISGNESKSIKYPDFDVTSEGTVSVAISYWATISLIVPSKEEIAALSKKTDVTTVQSTPTPTSTPPSLASISISSNVTTLATGSTLQLAATGTFSDQSTASVTSSATWSVVDVTGSATIDSSGLVTSVSAGTVTVTAAKGGVSDDLTLTITNPAYLYVADTQNHRIRSIRIDTAEVTTFAGSTSGFSGDAGAASAAQLQLPVGLGWNSAGDLFIAESWNCVVRKIATTGIISTIAGDFTDCSHSGDGGQATDASFTDVLAVAFDPSDNAYIAENRYIRKVSTSGVISNFGGTGATSGGDNGPATSAGFNHIQALISDSAGNIYVADSFNHAVRKIALNGTVTHIAGTPGADGDTGDGGLATSAQLRYPSALAFDNSGNLLIGECGGKVRKIDSGGVITIIAGQNTSGHSGDGGLATSAKINCVAGLAIDSSDNLYISAQNNHVIRKVDSSGIITTFAGTAGSSGSTNGVGSTARFNYPGGLAIRE